MNVKQQNRHVVEVSDKLIQDQELIIQVLLMIGDERSRYVASRAMDVAATMMLMKEMQEDQKKFA